MLGPAFLALSRLSGQYTPESDAVSLTPGCSTAVSAELEWKLFGDIAELAGSREVEVAIDAGDTLEDAFDALLAAVPSLRERVLDDGKLAGHVTVLLNGASVGVGHHPLDADDELGLLPPVSGG